MKLKVTLLSIVFVLSGFVSALAFAPQDEDVRGAFLTTRPKATSKSNKPITSTPRPRRRRPIVPAPDPTVKKSTTPSPVNAPRIGLGLTLFMRDSNGLAIRTDPAREFSKGDHVRFLIETSADGYLYVFNTTDNGQPVMIYPDPELDEGGNYFQAHVPFEIPSSVAAEERLRWLTFDEHAGAEKLYFVFSREPLARVPIEDDLIAYCRENSGKCPWNPAADVWAQVQKELNEPVAVARTTSAGSAQTSAEHRAVTRGIGLNRDDPEPSLIMLSASTSKHILVAAVDLIHKSARLIVNSGELGR
jgi:hypothetical protein